MRVSCFTVNCEEYLAKEETQIPVDEVFFYRCVCVCFCFLKVIQIICLLLFYFRISEALRIITQNTLLNMTSFTNSCESFTPELLHRFRFAPIFRFFKKREGEKRLKKPFGDDAESVEDVDDDEFEQLLSKSEGGNAASFRITAPVLLWFWYWYQSLCGVFNARL